MTSRAKVRGVFSAVVFLVLSILLVNPTGTSASFNTTITTPAPTTAVLRGYDVHANLLTAANTSESTGRLTAPLQAPVPRVGRLLPSSAVAADSAASGSSRLVIGRTSDLQAPGAIGSNEYTLLDRLSPDLGSPRANWTRNSSVLRQDLRNGVTQARDASPGDTSGQFLNAERNLLENRGWTYDPSTNMWNAP